MRTKSIPGGHRRAKYPVKALMPSDPSGLSEAAEDLTAGWVEGDRVVQLCGPCAQSNRMEVHTMAEVDPIGHRERGRTVDAGWEPGQLAHRDSDTPCRAAVVGKHAWTEVETSSGVSRLSLHDEQTKAMDRGAQIGVGDHDWGRRPRPAREWRATTQDRSGDKTRDDSCAYGSGPSVRHDPPHSPHPTVSDRRARLQGY